MNDTPEDPRREGTNDASAHYSALWARIKRITVLGDDLKILLSSVPTALGAGAN
jgi:hypothetical protein